MDFHASVLSSSLYKNSNVMHCDFYKSDLSYVDFSNSNVDTV
ncbi:pentapeptide repeat-containing protein [Paenibacillus polysaccharolyticus]